MAPSNVGSASRHFSKDTKASKGLPLLQKYSKADADKVATPQNCTLHSILIYSLGPRPPRVHSRLCLHRHPPAVKVREAQGKQRHCTIHQRAS